MYIQEGLDNSAMAGDGFRINNLTEAPPKQLKESEFRAARWLAFSRAVRPFLVSLYSHAQSTKLKALLNEIIISELGGDGGKPHDILLEEALVATLDYSMYQTINEYAEFPSVCQFNKSLYKLLNASPTDAQIAGILLGFELPAHQNLFLAKEAFLRLGAPSAISRTLYFQIHDVAEDAHMNKAWQAAWSVSSTEGEKMELQTSFIRAQNFWVSFWRGQDC
jgi:hypothetical protein